MAGSMEDPFRLEDRITALWNSDDPILWWNGEWMSAEKLFDVSEMSRAVLSEGGFGKGDRLMVLFPNCPSLLALSLACWHLGGTIVPVNPQAGPESVIATIREVEPAAVVIGEPLSKRFPSLDGLDTPILTMPLDASLNDYHGKTIEGSDSDIALLFSTSGTTGRPKIVPLSHGNIISDIEQALRQVSEISGDDVFLNVLPNFHTLGFIVSGLLPLLSGFRQVILPTFMPPEKTLAAMEAGGATVVVAVPTMLRFMIAAAHKTGRSFSSVRIVISGGDRFSTDLDARLKKVFGVPVLEGYGLTECSPILAVNPSYEGRKLGTVGPILEGIEWQVRDLKGEILGRGEEGVLWVRGPSVASEYFRSPDVSVEKFVDGWFDTGDIVSIDDDGYVKILDRASDMIIVGGFNVYPQEVENVLVSYPGVKEAAVVGKTNSMSGQVPCGYVILDPGASVTSGQLISYCKKHLAHYKVPRKIEMVDVFPRNSLGKVLRRVLRDSINEGLRK